MGATLARATFPNLKLARKCQGYIFRPEIVTLADELLLGEPWV